MGDAWLSPARRLQVVIWDPSYITPIEIDGDFVQFRFREEGANER